MRRQPNDQRSAHGQRRTSAAAHALVALLAAAVPASSAAESCVAPNPNCGDGALARFVQALSSTAPASSSTPALTASRPTINGFRVNPAVFAIARPGTALDARSRRGTHFSFTLSGATGVTLTIQRTLPRHRRRAMCVDPSPQLPHTARCTRSRTIGTLTRTGAKGTGTYTIAFTGRIGGRALPPGTYHVIIRATGAESAHSLPQSTRFRIVNA